MNNELGWNEIFFSVILSVSIVYVISMGILLNFVGFTIFGYLTFLAGGLFVYYLCTKYIEGEAKK